MKKAIRMIVGAMLIISALVVYLVPSESVDAVGDTAATTDFQLNGSTLVKYTGTAVTVSIPDTVKEIGEEAFADNGAIQSVVIPKTVESIEYAAFSGCSNLSKIDIPDSVEEIKTAAFVNCTSLSQVTIGSGLRKLGNGVFTGCTSLSDIKFNNKRFVCDKGAVMNDEKTKIYQVLAGKTDAAYSMPNTINQIGPYSFYGCSNLNAVTLSPNLQEIPAYSFSNCNGLQSVIIPYSVNNIDAKAFENCVNLGDVEINESVSYIHKTAFDGCPRLNIVAPTFSYAYDWFNSMDRSQVSVIDSEDNLTVEGSDAQTVSAAAIADMSANEKDGGSLAPTEESEPTQRPKDLDDLMDSYVSAQGLIGETIVVGRKAVVFINNNAQTVNQGETGIASAYAAYVPADISESLTADTGGKGLSIPKFAIIGDKIAGKAYYGDTSMDAYEIPENITKIGDFAFARSGIKSIEIPSGVTHIGYGAFYHCDRLAEVSIPSTVTEIEPAAFAKTKWLENWIASGSGNFLIVGDGILLAYKGGDSKITIPEDVKQIGPEAFKDHKGITDIVLPDSLTRICEDAFAGCSNLKNIKGGINLTVIEDRAFDGCPVETVRVVDTVKSLGLGAFDLSKTNTPEENKAVVFLGTELPAVSYNSTATRLANEDYRKDALSGVKVAIVQNENVVTDGTVLDKDLMGFSGLICTITSENNDYFNGRLNIIGCTLSASEAGNFSVPSTMIIFGSGYNFDEEQLNTVLEAAKQGGFESSEEESINPAYFAGSSDVYDLKITQDGAVDASVSNAYQRIYGENAPSNLSTFGIEVIDTASGIELTKFGRQKMSVTMNLPSNLPSANLHVICTDDYGQLEDISYKTSELDGSLAVTFDISHTGKYGMYSYGSNVPVSLQGLDESPDTGEGLSPKLFLSLGLFFAGLALLLIRRK